MRAPGRQVRRQGSCQPRMYLVIVIIIIIIIKDVHQEVAGVGRGRHQDGQRAPELGGGDLPEVDGGDGDPGPDPHPGDGAGDVEVAEATRLPGQQPAQAEGHAVSQDCCPPPPPEREEYVIIIIISIILRLNQTAKYPTQSTTLF